MSIRLPDPPCVARDVPEEARGLLSDEQDDSFPPLKSPYDPVDPERAVRLATRTPIPYLQVFLVAVSRASQPLAYFTIYPFVNQMLVELGVSSAERVGYYSGWLEAGAALSMMVALYPASRLADRIGRRPILITGVLVASFCGGSFGFGQSYPALLFIRAMNGVFNAGQGAVARGMFMELSDPSNRSQIFAFGGMGWQTGMTLAPLIGAAFAQPARRWPSVFQSSIFETYPYALPGVVACGIPFAVFVVAIFRLKETKAPRQREVGQKGRQRDLPSMWNRRTLFVLFCTWFMCFHIAAVLGLEVLLFFEEPSVGGLGFSPEKMAFFFFLRPLLITSLETTCFAPLERRFGIDRVFRTAIWFYPVTWTAYLASSVLASSGARPIWISGMVMVALFHTIVANLSFLALDVISFQRAPTKEQVIQMSAMGELSAQIGIASGSAVSSSMYAFCITHRLLPGGRLIWFIYFGVAVCLAMTISRYEHLPSWSDAKDATEEEL